MEEALYSLPLHFNFKGQVEKFVGLSFGNRSLEFYYSVTYCATEEEHYEETVKIISSIFPQLNILRDVISVGT